MAEAKKLKKPKTAMKELKGCHEDHKADQTIAWFLANGYASVTTAYNQWAGKMDQMDISLLLLDPNGNTKNYSQKYTGLTKFNPQWVGFYPSTYDVDQVVDEAGNTQKVKIVDLDQLKSFPSLRIGGKFYFAGNNYKVCNIDKRSDQNYIGFGESAEAQEMIVIRSCKAGYAIFNIAMATHKTRQTYGSGRPVYDAIRKYCKQMFFDEDGALMEQDEQWESKDW